MLRLFKITSLYPNKSLLLQNFNHIVSQRALLFNSSTESKLLNEKISIPLYQSQRNTNFFNKLPAEHLWKGVTSVSNAGKKRGRGKGAGKKLSKNLNRGQIIGVGKENIIWPGLNAPILRGQELVTQQKLPEDKERLEKLIAIRDKQNVRKRFKLTPLERGWSGGKMGGRSIGPPDPILEEKFEGFVSKVLELKTVFTMKGNFGRSRRMSALVITGNGKGLIGFSVGKAIEQQAALRIAKNRAAQRLIYIPLYNNHTIFHDFFCRFYNTKIFVYKKQEGFGLVCHRAIREICVVLGIKDIYAKIEGSNNLQNIVKAFLCGLLQMKTHEQLAEQKQLHLVEFRKEAGNYPTLIASPSYCRKEEEIQPNEVLDFTQYALNDKIFLRKKKKYPFYTRLPSWKKHCLNQERIRGHEDVRIHLRSQYGEIRSFLYDKYPECKVEKIKKESQGAENE